MNASMGLKTALLAVACSTGGAAFASPVNLGTYGLTSLLGSTATFEFSAATPSLPVADVNGVMSLANGVANPTGVGMVSYGSAENTTALASLQAQTVFISVDSANFSGGNLGSLTRAVTTGGVSLTSLPGTFSSGGQFTFANVDIDFTSNALYADVSGDHGVGSKSHVLLATFAASDVSESGGLNVATYTSSKLTTKISHLVFTQSAVGWMGAALGVKQPDAFFGPSLDLGSLTLDTNIRTGGAAVVPEPSTWLLLLGGGLAVLAKRRLGSSQQLA